MIKPIIYYSFKEKEIIERNLMAKIPLRKRRSVSKALMDIFFRQDYNAKVANAASSKN